MARPVIYRARKLLRQDFSVLDNGALACSPKGIITEVDNYQSVKRAVAADVTDLGEVLLIPGLINAHVHLTFSLSKAQLVPTPYFPLWLRRLVSRRLRFYSKDIQRGIEIGVQKCLAKGITTVVDICPGSELDFLAPFKLRKWLFYEVFGWKRHEEAAAVEGLRAFVRQQPASDGLTQFGISPHAPYSVSPQLYKTTAQLSKKYQLPLCTHLAETQDENHMLINGRGELLELLKSFKALPANWQPPGVSPTRHLAQLGILGPTTLLAHFNYPLSGDVDIIRNTGCNVVYCPGSHRFFSHSAHPLPRLLEAGTNVCLGTDSLASNFDLDIIREMRIAKQEFSNLKEEYIFRLATINAARALGQANQLGVLANGFLCDAAALAGPDTPLSSIKDIFAADGIKVSATIVSGSVLFHNHSA